MPRRKSVGPRIGQRVCRWDTKSMAHKGKKLTKWALWKLKTLPCKRHTLKRMKRHTTELEKSVFSNYISDKGLVLRMQKNSQNGQKTWEMVLYGKVVVCSDGRMNLGTCQHPQNSTQRDVAIYKIFKNSAWLLEDRWSADWDKWRQRNLTVLQMIHVATLKGSGEGGSWPKWFWETSFQLIL